MTRLSKEVLQTPAALDPFIVRAAPESQARGPVRLWRRSKPSFVRKERLGPQLLIALFHLAFVDAIDVDPERPVLETILVVVVGCYAIVIKNRTSVVGLFVVGGKNQ